MASYGAALPTVARSILAPCRLPFRQMPMMPMVPAFTGFQQSRGMKNKAKDKGKGKGKATKADRRGAKDFQQKDLKDMQQFALCDAMRYIRAVEVGREPASTKYEVHIRLKSRKDGPVIRNMIRFPHAVQTESRICVICAPGSKQAKDALAAGAVLVGRTILPAMNKAGLGRILGPRGLMPNTKNGTVTEDVANRVQMLRGGTIYRERDAVIRLPIGQLGFSPEQLRDNLRTTIEQVKKDAAGLNDQINKQIYEIVLSSTHGPGFSLNGEFKSENSPDSSALTGV
ncbi:hypothetical protein N7470_005994 [Penicillium chermesinum]|nr:hypothetical protein N7470_005994 [Penicillium chermesinum]